MGGHGKSQRELGGARWKAIALTSTLVIVPVALMFFSVAATTWLAKPTYGTTAEYLGTFLAAVGSTTAASVFSVLSLWTVESP